MLEVKELKNDFQKKWDNFVCANNGTIFHSWGWGQILKNTYNYTPLYLGAFENNELVGILLGVFWGKLGGHRLTSAPFADFSGPLGTPSAQKSLIQAFQKKVPNSQIFTDLPLSDNAPFCHFILDTKNSFEEILKNKIHQKTRNMINRAERENITVKIFEGSEFKKYYPLYFKTLLKLNSLPFSPKLFKELHKEFSSHNKVFLAFYKQKIVAAIWAFEWNNKLHIWGNASDQQYLNLGVNNAVYAAAISYACRQKLDYVDFGSTIPETPHHFFKKRWGGDEKPIYVLASSEYKKENNNQNRVVKILKILPRPILEPLCHLIYKYY